MISGTTLLRFGSVRIWRNIDEWFGVGMVAIQLMRQPSEVEPLALDDRSYHLSSIMSSSSLPA